MRRPRGREVLVAVLIGALYGMDALSWDGWHEFLVNEAIAAAITAALFAPIIYLRRRRKATQTATLMTEGHHTSLGAERESGSRLSESNRRPIHYE